MTFKEATEAILSAKTNTRSKLANALVAGSAENETLMENIDGLREKLSNASHRVEFRDSEIKRLNQEIRTLEAVVVHQSKKMMMI